MNQPKIKQFIVSGIYETGLREFDDMMIYTDMRTAQNLFNFGENVSGIEITLSNLDSVESAVEIIKKDIRLSLFSKVVVQIIQAVVYMG